MRTELPPARLSSAQLHPYTPDEQGCGAADTHYMGPSALTAQYLLVVDTLNFCFWPEPGLEYENLAKSLKVHRCLTAVSMVVCCA